MSALDYIPDNYKGIKVVRKFRELFSEKFGPANAIVLPSGSSEDFPALARHFADRCGGKSRHYDLGEIDQIADSLAGPERKAAFYIAGDMRDIYGDISRNVHLRVLFNAGYPDQSFYTFHADTGFFPQGRTMACYAGPVTEALRNDQAVETAANVFRKKTDDVRAFAFKHGDLWRQATANSVAGVPGFIHRAPEITPTAVPRLVLVADS